jgi:hypothetical protein
MTQLSYDRTVERSLVHRTAVSEVFVTDLLPRPGSRFLAAAQLPLTHGYYSDHVRPLPAFDPVLILEAGRQAGIAGASLLGLPADTIMLVGTFTLKLTDPAGLRATRHPGELHIDNFFEATRTRGGKVRQGKVRQDLALNGEPIGTHTMECQILRPSEHQALRTVLRDTPAPSTAELAEGPVAGHVPAHKVGRHDARNVVLADLEWDGERAVARIAPRFDNRALFDHAYDHLPAMTLTEAARQLAVVVTGDKAAQITEISGSFARFAELDEVLIGTASKIEPDGVRVEFQQGGKVIAQSELRHA